MVRLPIPILLIHCILSVAGCARRQDVVVAEVAGRKITVADVERASARLPALREKGIEQVLEALINKELLVLEAQSRGLDQSPGVLRELERLKAEKMRKAFERRIVESIEVSEEEMRRYFKEKRLDARTKVKVRHIVVKTRKEAEEILKALKQGGNFAQIAKERSIDRASAERGGNLGWWEEGTMLGYTAQKVFSMKVGELSEPIRSAWGYHIFQVLDRRPVGFEKQKPMIERALRMRKAPLAESKYLKRIEKELKLEMNEHALRFLLERVQSSLEDLPEETLNIPLFKYRGGKIFLRDYITRLRQLQPSRRPAMGDSSQVVQFAYEIVRDLVLIPEACRRMGIERSEEFQAYIVRKKEELMVEELRRMEIEEKVITPDAIRMYYQDHLNDYFEEAKTVVQAALLEDKEDAQKLLEEVRRGADMAVARNYPSIRDYGVFTFRSSDLNRKERGKIAKEVWKAEIGAVEGPVQVSWQERGRQFIAYVVFQVTRREEARQLSLDEPNVLEDVKKKLRLEKGRQIEVLFKHFLKKLRERYSGRIVIHKQNLKFVR